MNNKKAVLETKEIIELILGAAVTLVLILLIWALVSPSFNKQEKTAEAYFESLKKAIGEVDDGAKSVNLDLYQDSSMRIVYFGEYLSVESYNYVFKPKTPSRNQVCVCYRVTKNHEAIGVCNYCLKLKYPAIVKGYSVPEMDVPIRIIISKDDKTKLYTFEPKFLG